MSSQDHAGILLSHSPDGTGYKLLELPPEVLELLESQDCPTLTLHPSPTAALLKTPAKTYSLRQKNTSNALILLSPTSNSSDRDNVRQEISQAAAGLAIIATVHETVELVPEADEAAAAAPKARGKWHEKFARAR
ncbi:hypothetical protein N657DRAFT_688967 [Parathielavia appendiculata]|uniref:Sister chromatid cohesion protein DCC1 n=1 Tax=Parathielavia appendiculata TaxID=2587402 RepID=A0AAN6U531_9PEZI|nr:hypothetical protein N657DRAFT_688967 [Parathielavia appendiculata]